MVLAVSALLLAIAFAACMTFKTTVTVRGNLDAARGLLKVRPPVSGRLEKVFVHDGDEVGEGDVLALIDNRQFDDQGADKQKALQEYMVGERQRLQNEQDILELAYDNSRMTQRQLGMRLLEAISLVDVELDLLEQQLAASTEELEAKQQLLHNGAISKSRYISERNTDLAMQRQLQSLRSRRHSLAGEHSDSLARIAQVELDHEHDKLRLQQQLQKLDFDSSQVETDQYTAVVASGSGIVTAITARAGEFVESRQSLLQITPPAPALTATLYVPSRAIGEVRLEQELFLNYDAFSYQVYGSFKARVTSISRNTVDPREQPLSLPGLQESVFVVRASLDTQSVADGYPLPPGMLLSASLVTGELSLLEYILDPILRLKAKS